MGATSFYMTQLRNETDREIEFVCSHNLQRPFDGLPPLHPGETRDVSVKPIMDHFRQHGPEARIRIRFENNLVSHVELEPADFIQFVRIVFRRDTVFLFFNGPLRAEVVMDMGLPDLFLRLRPRLLGRMRNHCWDKRETVPIEQARSPRQQQARH